jgi:serine/threonine-protein kinase SRPK3
LSAQEGFGFFLGRPGLLLNKGRYEVLRKLGKGQYSSTWLACDSQYVMLSTIHIVGIELIFSHCLRCSIRAEEKLRYCAIKILTVYATKGHHDHNLLELEIMQTITSSIKTPYLPRLRDHFETEGPHGQHLCLVLPVLSDNVGNFRRSAPSKSLDPPKVKILIVQIVEALVGLHSANIIHTG